MKSEDSIKTKTEGLAIVEKYDDVIAYLYPIAQSIPRKHGVVRDLFLTRLFSIPDLLYQGAKTNQISKLYLVDAALADLRHKLRFLVKIRGMSKHQHQTSEIKVTEVGSMLNRWIKNHHKENQKG